MSMARPLPRLLPLLLLTLLPPGAGCRGTGGTPVSAGPFFARLGRPDGDPEGFRAVALAFARRNPGYRVEWRPACSSVDPVPEPRILFVQDGQSAIAIATGGRAETGEVRVGDLIVLQPGDSASFAAPVSLLEFVLPESPGPEVPVIVRPDFDPRLSDTPGGCATATDAYRRILLTWRRQTGPYTYRGLNAHRVCITDSFTHYHPVEGGFDEFYLVQLVAKDARLLTCGEVARIEAGAAIPLAEARQLIVPHELAVGDLVYLPRGLAHRGLGGVLAQVITVPGFVPGAEIGIDHHLRALDERLGGGIVPYHAEAAAAPVVR